MNIQYVSVAAIVIGGGGGGAVSNRGRDPRRNARAETVSSALEADGNESVVLLHLGEFRYGTTFDVALFALDVRVEEIRLGTRTSQCQGGSVIGHGRLFRTIKGAKPSTGRFVGIPNFRCPLSPRPLPDTSVTWAIPHQMMMMMMSTTLPRMVVGTTTSVPSPTTATVVLMVLVEYPTISTTTSSATTVAVLMMMMMMMASPVRMMALV